MCTKAQVDNAANHGGQTSLRMCRACWHVASVVATPADAGRKGDRSYSAGYTGAAVDHTGRLYCRRGWTSFFGTGCADEPLADVPMIGRVLRLGSHVYFVCPQPRCGRLARIDSTVQVCTHAGLACASCALAIHAKYARDSSELAHTKLASSRDGHERCRCGVCGQRITATKQLVKCMERRGGGGGAGPTDTAVLHVSGALICARCANATRVMRGAHATFGAAMLSPSVACAMIHTVRETMRAERNELFKKRDAANLQMRRRQSRSTRR